MTPKPSPPCYYCAEPADAFCDFIELRAGAGGQLERISCDRPICRVHGRQVGHICNRSRRKCGHDTIDFCTSHTDGAAKTAHGTDPICRGPP